MMRLALQWVMDPCLIDETEMHEGTIMTQVHPGSSKAKLNQAPWLAADTE